MLSERLVSAMATGASSVSEPTYFILAALLDGPLHGHAIIKQVLTLSDDRIKLPVGTLYGALDRLSANGLIVVDREEAVDGRPRRYFRLTEQGGGLVSAEAQRMQRAGSVVTSRVLRRTWTPYVDQVDQMTARIDQRVRLEIDGDPRLAELGAAMGSCLRDKGYAVDSAEPSALAQRGAKAFHAEEYRLGEKVPDALIRSWKAPKGAVYAPVLTPGEARPYLADEIKAALDDLECGKRFYPPHERLYGKIQREVYLEFGFYDLL
ncbi:PadR family transcriptional regulator [Sphaerisporangium sp. NPDC088356]|uniref:PadR family transcriptional regulator n=1 Tax=Sphaerisporangium sp. NPDC088356 TaxID=3154871 RepID=UPI00342905B7